MAETTPPENDTPKISRFRALWLKLTFPFLALYVAFDMIAHPERHNLDDDNDD